MSSLRRRDSRRRPRPRSAPATEPPLPLVAALVGAAVATRFLAIAVSPGEIDEAVFSGAVTRFDLADLSPQAPGFPVWILIGRGLLPVVPSPFHALAVAATLLSCVSLSRPLPLGPEARRRVGRARGDALRGVPPGRAG